MTGDEFRARILAALDEPCSEAELAAWGAQCAADTAQILLARVDAIVADELEDR